VLADVTPGNVSLAACRRSNAGHPRTFQPQPRLTLRPVALPLSPPQGERLLPDEGFPARGNPLRQPRPQPPVRFSARPDPSALDVSESRLQYVSASTCRFDWEIQLLAPLPNSPSRLSLLVKLLFCGATALMAVLAWSIGSLAKMPLSFLWLAMPSLFFFSLDALLAAVIAYRYLTRRADDVAECASGDGAQDGVPIVVPVLIRTERDVWTIDNLLDACSHGRFALPNPIWVAVDFRDADSARQRDDDLLQTLLTQVVDRWTGTRSLLGYAPVGMLVRARVWNRHEQQWMGYERKRGKIEEVLRYLNGEDHDIEVVRQACGTSCQLTFVMDIDSRIKRNDVGNLRRAFVEARKLSDPTCRPALMAPIIKKLSREREPIERWLIEPELFDRFFVRSSPTLKQAGLGLDIYHGKAMLHIQDFLDRCTGFEPNTVLSHDHVESLYGFGQSTHLAKAYEPFPNSRSDWEHRQHRWVRGDMQVAPYLFGRRRLGKRTMSLAQTFGSAHIVLGAVIPIFQYLFVVSNLGLGGWHGAWAIAVLLATEQRGFLFAVLDVARRRSDGGDHPGFVRVAVHAITNSVLVYAGLAIYLQRNFLITVDAAGVAALRLIKGRRGLLEWYPVDPSAVIRRRRLMEKLSITLFGLLAYAGICSTWLPVVALLWVLAPALISVFSARLLTAEIRSRPKGERAGERHA
jgi:cyclic beta-1,2-glucan synthetase